MAKFLLPEGSSVYVDVVGGRIELTVFNRDIDGEDFGGGARLTKSVAKKIAAALIGAAENVAR